MKLPFFTKKKSKESKAEKPNPQEPQTSSIKPEENAIKTPLSTKRPEFVLTTILEPHLTEKSALQGSENKYVFKVHPRATKSSVKLAIENLYGVKVTKLNIVNIPRKERRLGRIQGWKGGYKKAIVKIKDGQKIEGLSA